MSLQSLSLGLSQFVKKLSHQRLELNKPVQLAALWSSDDYHVFSGLLSPCDDHRCTEESLMENNYSVFLIRQKKPFSKK
jgi:hypothetical protein